MESPKEVLERRLNCGIDIKRETDDFIVIKINKLELFDLV